MRTNKTLILFLVSLSFLLTKSSFGQPTLWNCLNTSGGSNDDMALFVASDGESSGQEYVIGTFKSATIVFGSTTLTNTSPGTSDIFLVKYSNCGSVSWAKSYGTVNNDVGTGVEVLQSNIYITGYFNSTTMNIGAITITNNGNDDGFLAKVDNNGNVIWAKSFGGSGNERPTAICKEMIGGNLNLIGNFDASFTIGTNTLTNAGNSDIFWLRYNSTGSLTLARGYGSAGNEEANSISYSNNYSAWFICGAYNGSNIAIGSNTLSNTNPGTFDAFVFMIDGSFTETFASGFGGIGDDRATGLCRENSLGICVVGIYNSSSIASGSVTITNNGAGTTDGFLISFSPSLSPVWAKTVGGVDNDAIYGINLYSSRVYLTGSFNSASLTLDTYTLNNVNPGTSDVLFAAFDCTSGVTVLAKSAGSMGNDIGYSVNSNFSNFGAPRMEVVGCYGAPVFTLTGNSFTATNSGGSDMFLIRLNDQSIGLNEVNSDEGFSIYPNPVNNKLNIEFNTTTNENIKLYLYNMLGQIVYSNENEKNKKEIDLGFLLNGIYYLKAVTKEGQQVFKIIKE